MSRVFQQAFKLMDAVAANSTATPMNVEDYRNVEVTLVTSGSASGVIKFQIAQGAIAGGNTTSTGFTNNAAAATGSLKYPDFSSASSPSNPWTYVQVIDLADQSTVNGGTGITLSGTDVSRTFEVNINAAMYFTATLSGYSAGAFTIIVKAYNDVS